MDKKFIYTDEELIGRFQNGDEQAYIELANRFRDRLMSFVFRFVNDIFIIFKSTHYPTNKNPR